MAFAVCNSSTLSESDHGGVGRVAMRLPDRTAVKSLSASAREGMSRNLAARQIGLD